MVPAKGKVERNEKNENQKGTRDDRNGYRIKSRSGIKHRRGKQYRKRNKGNKKIRTKEATHRRGRIY